MVVPLLEEGSGEVARLAHFHAAQASRTADSIGAPLSRTSKAPFVVLSITSGHRPSEHIAPGAVGEVPRALAPAHLPAFCAFKRQASKDRRAVTSK